MGSLSARGFGLFPKHVAKPRHGNMGINSLLFPFQHRKHAHSISERHSR